MRVIGLVRERVAGAQRTFSQRELRLALHGLGDFKPLLTIEGGTAATRAELRAEMTGSIDANPQWGLVTLSRLNEQATGRKGKDVATPVGFLEALYDVGARLHYTDRLAFVSGLQHSPARIREALQQLSLLVPKQKPVVMLDVDAWPAQGGRRTPADVLSRAIAAHVDIPTGACVVACGEGSRELVPASVRDEANAIRLIT